MERKREVSAKLGPDNVSTLLAEVEAGRVTEVEMKQLALAMHDKVHGEFVYQKDKMKPPDLMKILLDKWFAVELYKQEVDGVKQLEEVLRECGLDYLVAKLNIAKKRPRFQTPQQMEEERLAEERRNGKLEGGPIIITESGVVILDELKGQQVNIFAVGGGGSLGDVSCPALQPAPQQISFIISVWRRRFRPRNTGAAPGAGIREDKSQHRPGRGVPQRWRGHGGGGGAGESDSRGRGAG